MRTFHLIFNKESNGCWYIDFPGYPLDHHNLMMVAGADLLCEYVADRQGHPALADVDVTAGDNLLEGRVPDIVMTRFEMGYGARYRNATPAGMPPAVARDGRMTEVDQAWICPVTLLVLFSYPKRINIYIRQHQHE